MHVYRGIAAALLAVLLLTAQPGRPARRWAMYEREMQDPADDPPDAWDETEFAFARLRYRSDRDGGGGGTVVKGAQGRLGNGSVRRER